MANITGARLSGAINQDRVDINIDQKIAQYRPSAAPLTVLLKQLSRKEVGTTTFQWMEDDLLKRELSVTNAYTAASAATDTLTVDDGAVVQVDDIIYIPSAGDAIVIVNSISGNDLTVTSVSSATIPSIAAGSFALITGNAYSENTRSKDPITTKTVTKSNQIETIRTPISFSDEDLKQDYKTESDQELQIRKKEVEHAKDIEHSILFNAKSTGNLPADKRTMDGLLRFIPGDNIHNVDYSTLSEDQFDNMQADIFEYGSEEKLVLTGPSLLQAITPWAKGKLEILPKEKNYGLNIRRYISPFGELYLLKHPLLNGNFSGLSFVVDLENLTYRYFTDSDTILRKFIQENDITGIKHEYLTRCSLQVKLPKTHHLIKG